MSGSSAEDVYANVVARREMGERVDIEEVCAAYPAFAPELRSLDAVGDRLRAGAPEAMVEQTPEEIVGATTSPHLLSILERLGGRSAAFGRYAEKGEIERGGMGRIIEVWDEDLERGLVMKVLHEGGSALERDSRKVWRLLDEARITGRLEHPGVVPVHEIGLSPDGELYFTMKKVRGRTLADVFTSQRAGDEEWSLARVVGLLQRVCETVAFAHDRGVVHRDLKPANVMVGDFGEVYVMDWGLAKATRSADRELDLRSADKPASPELTADGIALGTPPYMAPEQARGENEQVGPLADVYALGAMLYHVLSGKVPYADSPTGSAEDLVRLVGHRGPTALERLAPGVPSELAAVCEKAMAREPSARYAGALELAADLRAFLEGRVVRAFRTGPWAELRKWIGRNRLVAGVSMVALVALTGLLGYLVFLNTELRVTGEAKDDAILAKDRALGEKDQALEAKDAAILEKDAAYAAQERTAEELRISLELEQHERYVASITAARAANDSGDAFASEANLEACPPENRGWEWGHVSALGQASLSDLVHERIVQRALFTARGHVATVSFDKRLHLRDARTGEPVTEPARLRGWGTALDIDPSGTVLASGTRNGRISLWNAETLEPEEGFHRVSIPSGRTVTDLDFSSDGQWLAASANGTNKAFVYSVADASLVAECELGARAKDTFAIAFQPDGKRLAVATSGNPIALIETEGWTVAETLVARPGKLGTTYDIAFDVEGKRLASAHMDGGIRLWNTESSQVIMTLKGHRMSVMGVAFDGEGRRLVSAGADRSVRVWSLEVGSADLVLAGHTDVVYAAAFDPSGDFLVSASKDASARIWSVADMPGVTTLRQHERPVGALAFSRDSKKLATGGDDYRICLWDVESGTGIGTLFGHRNRIDGLAWIGDGSKLVSAGALGTIILWDTESMARVGTVDDLGADVRAIAGSPDGQRFVAVVGGKCTVYGLDLAERFMLETEQPVGCVAWSPDGARIATGARNAVVEIFDASTGKKLESPDGKWGPVPSVAFSPGSDSLAFASGDGTARIFDLESMAELHRLQHPFPVSAVAFHPEGDRLATGSYDTSLRVFDVRRGDLLLDRAAHEFEITKLEFSPDGRYLASGSIDFTARLWASEAFPERAWQRHDERERERRLEPRVLELLTEHHIPDRVLEEIASDPDLPPEDRITAERLTRFHASHPMGLNNHAYWVALSAEEDRAAYQLAYDMAQTAFGLLPNGGDSPIVKAGALYRLGQYEPALELLPPSEGPDGIERTMLNRGFLRMAAYGFAALASKQLGRDEDAVAYFALFQTAIEAIPFKNYDSAVAFKREVEDAFGQ